VRDISGTVQLLGAYGETDSPGNSVVVNLVGHGGAMVADDISPNQLEALRLLRSDLTVTLRGTNDEYWEAKGHSASQTRANYLAGLQTRFRVARETGGCIYVPHALNWRFSLAMQVVYQGLAKRAAKATGCDYANAFSSVWSASGSRQWTVDGLHPTTAGYDRLATALADLIAKRSELRAP
jgi:lysophospholipase L1-like esterase